MTKTEQTVEKAIFAVRDERAKHRSGSGTVGTPSQLEWMEMQLVSMLDDLHQGRFSKERIGLGHIVADSWPLGHELSELVCAAEHAYERAATRASA